MNGVPLANQSWMELEMSNTPTVALVSTEDYERVSLFSWRLMNTGLRTTEEKW